MLEGDIGVFCTVFMARSFGFDGGPDENGPCPLLAWTRYKYSASLLVVRGSAGGRRKAFGASDREEVVKKRCRFRCRKQERASDWRRMTTTRVEQETCYVFSRRGRKQVQKQVKKGKEGKVK